MGLGAVLVCDGAPVACFSDLIHDRGLEFFGAQRGVSKFNTLWEALAILAAILAWSLQGHAIVEVRSGSLAALGSMAKLSSSSPALSRVAAEFALDRALLALRVDIAVHIPGVANNLADALSRLSAPEPKSSRKPSQARREHWPR